MPRSAVYAACMLCLGLGLFSIWHASRENAHSRAEQQLFFSATLEKAAVSETVSVNGSQYTVENGAVLQKSKVTAGPDTLAALRLAYAKTLARRSPLMAIPGTDPDMLDAAILKLERIQNDFAAIQASADERNAVRSALFPTRFLSSMAAVERARAVFIEKGGAIEYAAYVRAQHAAVAAYLRDIASFTAAFSSVVPTDTANYADAAYIVSRASVLEQLDRFATGVKKTDKKITEREQCVGGRTDLCNTDDLQFATISVPTMTPISPTQAKTAEEIFSTLLAHTVSDSHMETRMFRLSRSECTESLASAPLFVFRAKQFDGDFPITQPFYTGDLRLIKQKDATQTDFGAFLQSHGISYINDSPFTHYTCTALPVDMAHLFFTRDVMQFAQSTSTKTMPVLADIRMRIANATDPVREDDAVRYITALVHEKASDSSDDAQHAAETLYLERLDQSAKLDQFIGIMDRFESINVHILRRDVPIALGAKYLFYVRSAFLGLFMGNNPSVVGLPETVIARNTVSLGQQPYVRYTDLSPAERSKALNDWWSFSQFHLSAESPL